MEKNNLKSKIKKIILMSILLIISTILSYKVYAAKQIYFYGGGDAYISPGSLFCINHGLHSAKWYRLT